MEECKRVLHILHSMNCGGAENLIMNIYRNIDRSRIQFDFLVNYQGEMYFEKEIQLLGGRIFRMKFLTQLTPPVYKRQLRSFFLRHREYNIVHSHLETTTGIILGCAKRVGVPVRIAHSHNSAYTRKGFGAVIENTYKSYCKTRILPNATTLFACSASAAKWLFKTESGRAVIIKNAIETEKFRFSDTLRKEIREELGIREDTLAIGNISRFCDQKNHLFLIDIFEAYEKRNPDSVLLLAGEGPLKEQVKEKAASKDLLGKIEFLGLREDVHRLLQGIDIFVLPSKFEGLPVVLVEAQASGVCCFVSEYVSHEADLGCGLMTFLPLGSAESWADKISKSNTGRSGMSEQVASAGYDIRTAAKWLEEFYCEVRS